MIKKYITLLLFLFNNAYSNTLDISFSKTIRNPFNQTLPTTENAPIVKNRTNKDSNINNKLVFTNNKILYTSTLNNDLVNNNTNPNINNNSTEVINYFDNFNNLREKIDVVGYIDDNNQTKLFMKYNNILINPRVGSVFEGIYKIKLITNQKIYFYNLKNLTINEFDLPKRTIYEQY